MKIISTNNESMRYPNEYRSNLVNNLEVLDSLRRYQEVERRYHEARYATRKNYWKLKVALGDVL